MSYNLRHFFKKSTFKLISVNSIHLGDISYFSRFSFHFYNHKSPSITSSPLSSVHVSLSSTNSTLLSLSELTSQNRDFLAFFVFLIFVLRFILLTTISFLTGVLVSTLNDALFLPPFRVFFLAAFGICENETYVSL